jgi:hypothetical protein
MFGDVQLCHSTAAALAANHMTGRDTCITEKTLNLAPEDSLDS